MPVTKQDEQRMRQMRQEGMLYSEIGAEMGISKQLAYYYCREIEDQDLVKRMIRLREGSREPHRAGYGIGMTLEQIGEVVDMSNQKVSRYLAAGKINKRRCLYDHKLMIPKGKFRLWCDERCHRNWVRVIKHWKGT